MLIHCNINGGTASLLLRATKIIILHIRYLTSEMTQPICTTKEFKKNCAAELKILHQNQVLGYFQCPSF